MNVQNYAAYASMATYQKTREFQEEYKRKHSTMHCHLYGSTVNSTDQSKEKVASTQSA